MTDSDLEITVGCAAVHPDQRGGQHVAMRCTGVRVTHKPTGISVLSMDERSQYANRTKAMQMLSAIIENLPDVIVDIPADKPWRP